LAKSRLTHQTFISTLIRRQVVEKWRRCGGSSEPISVVRDFFWEERLLQALLTPHFCAWQGRPGARDCDVAP
jgi:hypothetical protein